MTTPEQFKEEMQKIRNDFRGDREEIHIRMDNALCRVLVELGYGKGVKIFNDQDKWYA